MIKKFLTKIKDAKIHTKPYEHIIVDNVLPSRFYKKLASDLEADNFNQRYTRGGYGNKERFGVDITDYKSWKNSKVSTLIHKSNYEALPDSNVKVFFDLLLEHRQDLYTTLCSKLHTNKIKDNYFFHTSMVKDSVGYEIEKHTDSEENIFTILFYAPQTDVNKQFGLHVYENGDNEDGVKSLEFIQNRMIVFAPCEQNKDRPPTWHEVKRLTNELVGTRNSFQMFFYKND